MSGSFGEDLNVPPTLVSFAVAAAPAKRVISPEFKAAGHSVYIFKPEYTKDGLPDYQSVKNVLDTVSGLITEGIIISAWALSRGGVMEGITKMVVGNRIGFEFAQGPGQYPEKLYGAIMAELTDDCGGELLGRTIAAPEIRDGGMVIPLSELQEAWEKTLKGVFPYATQY
jgi:phosphoribosylformylglycinamidine synthase